MRLRRIESLYKPYHRALRRLFTRLHRDFGAAILVDCHSMPSTAGHRDDRPRPEFVLGDRYGTSCTGAVSETVEKTLRGMGYSVSRNKPYAGGFITEHYGNPAAGLHAIQLEINRGLYMDERRYVRSQGFGKLAADLEILAVISATSRSRNCGLTGRRPNKPTPTGGRTKKGPLAVASGPSLGRKRPRRAAVSLPHCNNLHRDAQNARRIAPYPMIFAHSSIPDSGLPGECMRKCGVADIITIGLSSTS